MATVNEKNLGPELKVDLSDIDKKALIVRLPLSIAESWEKAMDGAKLGEFGERIEGKICINIREDPTGSSTSSFKYLLDSAPLTEQNLVFKMQDEQRRCVFVGKSEPMIARQYIDRAKPINQTKKINSDIYNRPSAPVATIMSTEDLSYIEKEAPISFSREIKGEKIGSMSGSISSTQISGSKRKLSQQETDEVAADINLKLKKLFTKERPRHNTQDIKDFLAQELRPFDQTTVAILQDVLNKFYFQHTRGEFRHCWERKATY